MPGAGPSGLSAAYYLSQLGYKKIVVFEKEREVGGKCKTITVGDISIDVGASLINGGDTETLAIVKLFNLNLIQVQNLFEISEEGTISSLVTKNESRTKSPLFSESNLR